MEGKKKSTVKKSSTKSRKTVKKTTLSNDELLDQILTKKKNIKKNSVNKSKKVVSKEPIELTNKQRVEKQIRDINTSLKDPNISGDKILELINQKKKLRLELNKIKKEESSEFVKNIENDKTIKDKDSSSINKAPSPKEKVYFKSKQTEKNDEEKVTKKPYRKNAGVDVQQSDKSDGNVSKSVTKVVKKKEKKKIKEKRATFKISKFKFATLLIVFALIVGVAGGIVIFKSINESFHESTSEEVEVNKEIDAKKELQEQQYNECLMKPANDIDRTENIIALENELSEYLNKYKTSVGYYDINVGYSYFYNEDQVYYAASSIKAFAVLYLYKEADDGLINLDDTMKYTSKYKTGASKEMEKISLNSDVKLRDLAKYTITVSDNTAYAMLVSYLGKSNIQDFGKSLGAKYTLVGGDNFGNITVDDGLIYWKAINEFINTNSENANEFYSYLLAADQNGLTLDDYGIVAAHKYGEYSPFYNDLGIVYSENPYIVVILTREFGSNMIPTIQDINSHIYNLHLAYYTNRESICKTEVYGN